MGQKGKKTRNPPPPSPSLSQASVVKPHQKSRRLRKIPQRVRIAVWDYYIGDTFGCKCWIGWCSNQLTPFDFQVGHNVPHSKDGTLDIDNLRPICRQCNSSMSDQYTIDEWSDLISQNQSRLGALWRTLSWRNISRIWRWRRS